MAEESPDQVNTESDKKRVSEWGSRRLLKTPPGLWHNYNGIMPGDLEILDQRRKNTGT